MIAGAHAALPQTREDLTYHGSTSHGEGADAGYLWTDKSYALIAKTDEEGRLYVSLGIWGTWENPRTYHLDDIRIDYVAQ